LCLIGLSFNLIALLFLSHIFIPKSRAYTSKFFTLSHYNTKTGKYASSSDDFCFISFCVVLITGLRAACMEYILSPLANLGGIPKKKEAARFAEQAWLWIYANAVWPVGLVSFLEVIARKIGADRIKVHLLQLALFPEHG
jgi:acyl-CoA-dependent ceramide synthase